MKGNFGQGNSYVARVDAIVIKGDQGPILKGNSSQRNSYVARVNAIVLPQDLAKYANALMLEITNFQKELLYEVRESNLYLFNDHIKLY